MFPKEPSPTLASEATKHAQSYAQNLVNNARAIVENLSLIPMIGGGPTIDYLLNELDRKDRKHLIILDQKVPGIERLGTRTSYGYEYQVADKKITVIDHLVSDSEFSKLSTGNLVLEYFKKFPEGPPKDALISITHGDADSVISALMMRKQIPALPEFGVAVMAADHTFQLNPIADLLQALEATPSVNETVHSLIKTQQEILAADPLHEFRNDLPDNPFHPSLEKSIRNLGLLLQGKELDQDAQAKVQERANARSKWISRIDSGQVVALDNGTTYCLIPETIIHDPCPEFLQALLPQSKIILVFHNPPEDPQFVQVRAILGNAAPDYIALNDGILITEEIIPGFGGRRDAGSNRRNKISLSADPKLVAELIDSNLWKQLQKPSS